MGGAHRHLLIHEEGLLHRLPPQCKLAATVLFVFAVVATPREQFWAFGVQAGLVVLAAAHRGCPVVGGGSTTGDRGALPPVRRALADPGTGPSGRRARRELVRAWAVGGLEHRRQGDDRGGGIDRPGGDDVDPAGARRPRAIARAPGDRGDHRVHDPLWRRDRRRGPEDVDRSGVAVRPWWPIRTGARPRVDRRRPVRALLRTR